ncbi:magnesium and cobalt transport protein CorA [Nonlabens dokdonensis]|uniref:Magnesium transport protein CorA n=1 Tax=Nonlabens dokdonensis TaxID=328515 RepID=A0A1Z8BC48_9FLAO|nr:magnesium/cobalt transporter CorA [Nonlabens dokdonensis]OUS20100.1 magnesium and cobalt transport protein CorA [Nonlabens dokdonensis]
MKKINLRLRRKATPKSTGTVFQPPGTISYVGEERTGEVSTETILYDTEHYSKQEGIYLDQLKEDRVNWFNIDGVHDIDLLEKVGNKFHLHHLLLEDIANTTQRPKTEFYGAYIYQCIKMISYDAQNNELNEEQVSIILTEDAVISFQEKTGDVFENIRERIENSRGRIRNVKSDYLFYALIDSIIDHYFLVIEQIGEYLDQLEDEIFDNPQKDSLNQAQKNKRMLLKLRRAIFPLRESISRLLKEDSSLIESKTHAYLQDAYDHCIQIIETVETYREINAGLRDMYLSSVSHKMNQIMQVLTIVSSLFIPMTFVAGIYGMNFEHIPELTWDHGYQYFWIINAIIFFSLLGFFKWKKWI